MLLSLQCRQGVAIFEELHTMRRLLNRLYYLTETLFVRNPLYQLMLVAVVILGISVLGGVVVHVTNPQAYSNTLEAIWWAFLRLTDPGYLGNDHGVFPRLISTFLTMAGYVLFLGALVALMTNWLDRSLKFLASGRSPIFEADHILIIGWNQKVHALIGELVRAEEQSSNSGGKTSIVILCESYEPSMYRELMQKLAPEVRGQCRVQIRSGNPLEAESLERVDFTHARSIILIADESTDQAARALSDTKRAKILMSMKARAPDLERPPTVVAEVARPANKFLIESAGWERHTEAVVADDILGRILCQSVRYPGMARVYERLLTDTCGSSLALRSAKDLGLVGSTLRESMLGIKCGVPIGTLVVEQGEDKLRLLELDHAFEEEEQVVLVSSKDKELAIETLFSTQTLSSRRTEKGKPNEVLVVGWSTDLVSFLKELSAKPEELHRVTLLWDKPCPKERQRLERIAEPRSNLELVFGFSSRLEDDGMTEALKYSSVVFLADQNQGPLLADAENIMRCVQFSRVCQNGVGPHLLVELNDEDNLVLLKDIPSDVLVTSEILSHLLAQVSTHRSLMWVYEELFTKGGAELRLRALSESSQALGSLASYKEEHLEQGSVVLGFCREGKVCLSSSSFVEMKKGDQLITVEMEDGASR